MIKKNLYYIEEFKLMVLRVYYSSGMTKYACCKKYLLRSDATLLNLLHKYESENKSLSLPRRTTLQGYVCTHNRNVNYYSTAFSFVSINSA